MATIKNAQINLIIFVGGSWGICPALGKCLAFTSNFWTNPDSLPRTPDNVKKMLLLSHLNIYYYSAQPTIQPDKACLTCASEQKITIHTNLLPASSSLAPWRPCSSFWIVQQFQKSSPQLNIGMIRFTRTYFISAELGVLQFTEKEWKDCVSGTSTEDILSGCRL